MFHPGKYNSAYLDIFGKVHKVNYVKKGKNEYQEVYVDLNIINPVNSDKIQ